MWSSESDRPSYTNADFDANKLFVGSRSTLPELLPKRILSKLHHFILFKIELKKLGLTTRVNLKSTISAAIIVFPWIKIFVIRPASSNQHINMIISLTIISNSLIHMTAEMVVNMM